MRKVGGEPVSRETENETWRLHRIRTSD